MSNGGRGGAAYSSQSSNDRHRTHIEGINGNSHADFPLEKRFLEVSNYISLARTIAKMSKPHLRHSYYISPAIDHEKIKSFPIPLIPIETDGAHFFEQLRIHLKDSFGII